MNIAKIALILSFLSFPLHAVERNVASTSPSNETNTHSSEVLTPSSIKRIDSLAKQMDVYKSESSAELKSLSAETNTTLTDLSNSIENISTQINNQNEKIDSNSKDKQANSLGMNFAVWTGILLACVTAIVTILGVGIAIGSIFGYKKIMSSATERASEVAKDALLHVAKKEITEKIIAGEFNDLITEAVDRVAFGSININANEELNEQNSNQDHN